MPLGRKAGGPGLYQALHGGRAMYWSPGALVAPVYGQEGTPGGVPGVGTPGGYRTPRSPDLVVRYLVMTPRSPDLVVMTSIDQTPSHKDYSSK